jgi:quinol monooxygenase YgiN
VVQGRIKRLRSATLVKENQTVVEEVSICALCSREIPPALRDAHHLIPKSKGGVVTVTMHRACHKQVHALFTETELARQYPNIEALQAHFEIAKFINWVKQKPNDLNLQTRRSRNKRST